jgi:hypothetical protein
VIEEDEHLLSVLRDVVANPLRAGLVSDLAGYPWSSYHVHGLGKGNPLVEEAPVWARLGPTEAARPAYQRFFRRRKLDGRGHVVPAQLPPLLLWQPPGQASQLWRKPQQPPAAPGPEFPGIFKFYIKGSNSRLTDDRQI